MADFRVGSDQKLYYVKAADRATGLPNTPTVFADVVKAKLTLMDLVRDVTISAERGEADVTTRGGGGFKQYVPTNADFSVETQLVYSPDDTDFQEWKSSWANKTAVAFALLDNSPTAAAGTKCRGFYFEGVITNFSQNEGLEEGVVVDVRIRQTISSKVTFELVDFTVPGA